MDGQNYEQFEKQYENFPLKTGMGTSRSYDEKEHKTHSRHGAKSNPHHHSTLCKLIQRNKRLGKESRF